MGKVEEIGKARAIETRDAEHTSLQQNPQPSTLNPQPSTLNPGINEIPAHITAAAPL